MTLDDAQDVNISFFDGNAWTLPNEICSNTSLHNDRCAMIAYESKSGDLLMVYWNADLKKLGVRTSSGGAISAEIPLALPSNKKVRFVRLESKATTDEIMMLAMNDANDLYAAVWNGNAFGTVTTLETKAKTDGNECFDAAYESISGDCLVVYSEKKENAPRYRIWDGATWTPELSMPSVGGEGMWLRLVSNPKTDEVLFGSIDSNKNLNVSQWNGQAWATTQQLSSNIPFNDRRGFDMAYNRGGDTAVIVFAESTSPSPQWRAWSGSTWSSQQSGPSISGGAMFVQAITSDTPGQILFALSDQNLGLNVFRWTGTGMSNNAVVESWLGGDQKVEQFMIAVPPETAKKRITRWREVPRAE